MQNKAVFRFTTPYAETICKAVTPEDEDMGRSVSKVYMDGDSLILDIGAEDISALRAALNTWLRLIQISEEMQETVKQ